MPGEHDTTELAAHHLTALAASGITPEHAAVRGYETITDPKRLADFNIVKAARGHVPGLLVPMLRVDGSTWGYQYRPDNPRLRQGKPVKYETPYGQPNGLDVPPGVADKLRDPAVPLWITEGCKKADCGALHGLCIVALSGVWNWLHTNSAGGKMAFPEWHDLALNGRRVIMAFDGDAIRKPSVLTALHALANYLATKGAKIEYLHLPDTPAGKVGLDDYLVEHDVESLLHLVKPTAPPPTYAATENVSTNDSRTTQPKAAAVKPISLEEAHTVFRKWLGDDYDGDTLDAMLATAAVERFGGDPVWLLIVSGSGNAKTETVQALYGINAIVTSTITSEAALLSATPKRDHAQDATGGLLRKIGERGVLVIKDVTSILSMNRDLRARVLAALREIYDGYWCREVGTDGGKSIPWTGRLAVVGAVTTAWDTHHSVIAMMGDRFVLVRADSTKARLEAGRQAIRNTGSEQTMRAELAGAVAGVIAGMNTDPITVTDAESEILLAAADLVTLARTAVEVDYSGKVIEAHAPEMPTRFAKQLTQIVRGAVAIGMDRRDAMKLAIRCARDSMPPLRLSIIDDVAAHPDSTTSDVRRRIDQPHTTVGRQLDALHMLRVVKVVREEEYGPDKKRWHYSLADGINPKSLQSSPEKSVITPNPNREGCEGYTPEGDSPRADTDKSGEHCACGEPLTRLESIGRGCCEECSLRRR